MVAPQSASPKIKALDALLKEASIKIQKHVLVQLKNLLLHDAQARRNFVRRSISLPGVLLGLIKVPVGQYGPKCLTRRWRRFLALDEGPAHSTHPRFISLHCNEYGAGGVSSGPAMP